MKKYIILICGLFLGLSTMNAQTKKAYLRAAEEAYNTEDYYSAMTYFQNALDFNSDDHAILYKAAESSRKFNAYTIADSLYTRVLELEDDGQYPDALYWSANMKQKLGKYDEAIELYSQYLAENGNDEDFLTKVARKNIESVKWAQEQVELAGTNEEDSLKNLSYLNTPYSEVGAYVIGDSLYFSSLRFENENDENNPERIFSKMLISKDSSDSEMIGSDFNETNQHTAHTTFSPSNNRMYFTICEYITSDNIRCDLYYTDIVDGEFSTYVKLPESINNDSITSTQPAYGVNPVTGDDVLYYVSNRDGGKGNLDIWMIPLKDNDEFGDPINLDAINSIEDDITPYYDIPGKTLYFSSEAYMGFGGFDVYSTNYYKGEWTKPDNLGTPINGSYNDIYLTIDHKNDEVIVSSNRPGSQFLEDSKEACCYDLYRGKLPYLKNKLIVQIFDDLTKDSLPGARTTLTIVNTDLEESQQHPDSTQYFYRVKKNKEYKVTATKEGYLPAEITFSTKNMVDTADIIKKLYLVTEELHLDVNVFSESDSMPLVGAMVKIIPDVGDPDEMVNNLGNDFHKELDRNRTYRIIVSRKGYKSKTLTITPADYRNVSKIIRDVYLPIGSLEDFLPLVLFFDNDHPNPDSWSTKTDLIFAETFNPYYARKDEFISNYVSPITESQERGEAASELEAFFVTEVKKGNDDLIIFLEIMDSTLIKGQKVQIFIKGYASPRFSRSYNLALGKRRIASVKNQIMEYKDGYFADYVKSGQLVVKEKSFGSTTSPNYVVSDLNNERMSIYSYDASKERRVEIVDVKFGE